jgi:hypothetical protein
LGLGPTRIACGVLISVVQSTRRSRNDSQKLWSARFGSPCRVKGRTPLTVQLHTTPRQPASLKQSACRPVADAGGDPGEALARCEPHHQRPPRTGYRRLSPIQGRVAFRLGKRHLPHLRHSSSPEVGSTDRSWRIPGHRLESGLQARNLRRNPRLSHELLGL